MQRLHIQKPMINDRKLGQPISCLGGERDNSHFAGLLGHQSNNHLHFLSFVNAVLITSNVKSIFDIEELVNFSLLCSHVDETRKVQETRHSGHVFTENGAGKWKPHRLHCHLVVWMLYRNCHAEKSKAQLTFKWPISHRDITII